MRTLLSFVVLSAALLAFSPARGDTAPPGQFAELGHDVTLRVVIPAGLAGVRLAAPNRYSLEAGVFPSGGFGLGLDFFSTHAVPLTLAFAVQGSAKTDETNNLNAAALVGVGRWFLVGALVKLSPDLASWYLTGGLDVLPLFLNPSLKVNP